VVEPDPDLGDDDDDVCSEFEVLESWPLAVPSKSSPFEFKFDLVEKLATFSKNSEN
jgi:hypothetical protein